MDVDTADEGEKSSQWIKMQPLSPTIHEPHIMEMMQSISVKRDDQSSFRSGQSGGGQSKWWHFKMKSVGDARKFVEKFNGKTMKKNGGSKIEVEMMSGYRERSDPFEGEWLKIVNLDPKVSEKQLVDHIQNKSKKKPKFLEIHPHSKGEYPSFAIVQMETLKDAEAVIEKLRMTALKGQKMWTRKCRERYSHRAEFKKGSTTEVMLGHLPMDMEEGEIRKMCSKYGTVKRVKINVDKEGYYSRSAMVSMSGKNEASRVFDGLHQKKVSGCNITTMFWTRHSGTNTLYIGGCPESVSQEDIRKFVSGAVDERPLHIKLVDSTQDSSKGVFVVFSKFDVVAQCIRKLKGKKLGGVNVKVNTAKPNNKEARFGESQRGKARRGRFGGSKKLTAKKKLKGSAFSGQKKVGNAKKVAKGKGKGHKQKKKGIKQ